MNGDTNKHKLLSKEELFRLLETKDESTLPGTGLDDFEREALEGFSKHSSVEKARELTAEIDALIHKNLNEKKTTRPVPRVIWFSAAASVLLLIILSFYFLTETTGPGKPELALNNSNSTVIMEKGTSPVVPPAEEAEVTISREPAKKEVMLDELQQQTVTIESKNTVSRSVDISAMNKDDASAGRLKGDAVDYNLATANVSANSASDASISSATGATKSANKKQSEGLNDADSEKSKYAPAPVSQNEDLKISASGSGAVATNNTPVQQKDDKPAATTAKPGKEQEIVYETTKTNNAEAKQVPFKKRKKEAGADKMVAAGTTAQTQAKEERKSPSDSASNSAYFAGGEEAVKIYVIERLKKQNYKENELQGTYTVRMKILANGTVSVITIDPEKSGYLNMAEPVKKVLNEMDGWKPAMINGSVSDSEIVIHLAF